MVPDANEHFELFAGHLLFEAWLRGLPLSLWLYNSSSSSVVVTNTLIHICPFCLRIVEMDPALAFHTQAGSNSTIE